MLLLAYDEDLNKEGEIVLAEAEEEKLNQKFRIERGDCHNLEFLDQYYPFVYDVKTLRYQGKIEGNPILILVDSGATYRFISRKLVDSLRLYIEEGKEVVIRLGDGTHQVRIQEYCPEITISMGEYQCQVRALVFDTGKLDMILGIEWLGHEWKEQTMKF